MVIDTSAIIAILRGEPEAVRLPRAMPVICRLAALLAVAGVVAAIPAALAQPYRYVDEDGVTVYSQSPPPGSAAAPTAVYQVPLDPGPPPGEFEAARERLQRQLEAEVDAREAARQAAEKQDAEAAKAAERKARCAAARQNRETVQNLGARRLRRADGTIAPVGDAERAELIREAEQQINESCD